MHSALTAIAAALATSNLTPPHEQCKAAGRAAPRLKIAAFHLSQQRGQHTPCCTSCIPTTGAAATCHAVPRRRNGIHLI